MEKDNLHYLHIPTRNWLIYWDKNFLQCAPHGTPLCTGKYPHYYPGIFFISYCTLTNISSRQPCFCHTYKNKNTHTHITEEPIFISGLLPLKTGVLIGYLNNLKHFNISKNSPHKRNAKLETVMNNLN